MVFSQCAMIIPHTPLAEEDGRHLSQRGAGAQRVATIEFGGWGPSKIDFRIGKRMEKDGKESKRMNLQSFGYPVQMNPIVDGILKP